MPATTASLTGVSDDYEKEVSKAFEAGFKAKLLDRRSSINGAIYHTEVDDMQYFNFFAGPFGLLRVVTNLDEVTIQGAEFDFRWLATDHVTILRRLRLHRRRDRPLRRPAVHRGQRMPYVPEYTGNLGVELRFRWAAAGSSSSRASTAASSARPGSTRCRTNSCRTCSPASASARASSRSRIATPTRSPTCASALEGERWGVTAWGRNITDEDYLQEVISGAGIRRLVHPRFAGRQLRHRPQLLVQMTRADFSFS